MLTVSACSSYGARSVALLLFMSLFGCQQSSTAQDSGGVLLAEQQVYDVYHYDLDVEVQPDARAMQGTLTARAAIGKPLDYFVLNLDRRLTVDSVMVSPAGHNMLGQARVAKFERRGDDDNQVWIRLQTSDLSNDSLTVSVTYGGQPRVAPQPPWNGGFTWAETPDGQPWIATSCQTIGADIWWPVKDHPSDEPDSMDIRVTVPEPLTVASNGVLRGVDEAGGKRTYHWHVSTPINVYTVALNIAPYVEVDTTYASTSGMDVPVTFYALPQDSARARAALPQFLDQVRFLEDTLGPYPFRADKYGIAQTPFLGMEHQTIIAYGNNFDLDGGLGYNAGFDALHFHELAHEWYGNLVTVADWKDFWLHEGFATYLEALYAADDPGGATYDEVIQHFRQQVTHSKPIVEEEPTSAQTIYSGDIYYKGAMVLHTLRYLMGDEAFMQALRRMAYPDPELETITSGLQCRHATTDDFVRLANNLSGEDLGWFFDAYLYHAEPPTLQIERTGDALQLTWDTPADAPFTLPVPVQVGEDVRVVDMTDGTGRLAIEEETDPIIDPERRILMRTERVQS